MNANKQIRVSIPKEFIGPYTGELVTCEHSKFRDWAGGYMATALFEGRFQDAVFKVIGLAESRGAYHYHQGLITKK